MCKLMGPPIGLNQAESGRYEIHQMYGSHVARDITILRTVQMVGLWYVAAPKEISLPRCLYSTVRRMSNLDFSKPWELSDVVLVVEGDKFHVHRCILGMWSEVFSTMFTSQFKEKTAEEVPLPGKKSDEIKEMLLVIYPTSAKPIDESNNAFLLDLAKEYVKVTSSVVWALRRVTLVHVVHVEMFLIM